MKYEKIKPTISELLEVTSSYFLILLVLITFPLWIIPYLIYKINLRKRWNIYIGSS